MQRPKHFTSEYWQFPLRPPPGATASILVFVVAVVALLATGRRDYPVLHAGLDAAACLLAGVLALLFWDMGTRLGRMLPRWIALAFTAAFACDLIHVLVAVEWEGVLRPIAQRADDLRPATFPVAAYILPLGVSAAIWLYHRGARGSRGVAVVLALAALTMDALFYSIPRYQAPGWLGMTRPTLAPAPVLWLMVAAACWHFRRADRLFPVLGFLGVVLAFGSVPILYSRSPHDTMGMATHLGLIAGQLATLLWLMHAATVDMLERVRADQRLNEMNEALEERVELRTAELASANSALEAEAAVRMEAERHVRAQLERLGLLHQITRGIGERHDLESIFRIVVGSVEEQLPSDFACVGIYDPLDRAVRVTAISARGEAVAQELALAPDARIPIDQHGLSRCIEGRLVYEPDAAAVESSFSTRFASAGLRSVVLSPLLAESRVFGVLLTARRGPNAFNSGECEFLRQLSEHTALAAHQAQLNTSLQVAYDDLRLTQQAVMQQERLRALGQMASGVAHDINNAITPVILYAEALLEEESGLSEEGRHDLEVIRRAIDDVAVTVARLGEFYRPGEGHAQFAPVELNGLVEQVVDLTRARWSDMPQRRGSMIELAKELAPGLPAILGAESEIRETLTNLIFNAVDAMPSGGRLTLRSGPPVVWDTTDGDQPRSVWVEVGDTGVGMSEEVRRRCLEPFFTTKGDRGTGLGLAMVYGAAQRHGADVDIQSELGQGTTIRLTFPVLATVGTSAVPGVARDPMRALRILIVDDDPVVLRALGDILRGDGHAVTSAGGGREGLHAFSEALQRGEALQVVITDLGMPYVDGRQVAGGVKALSPETPVILLTGWGERLKADGDVPPEVDQVLSKPPRLRAVREALLDCFVPIG